MSANDRIYTLIDIHEALTPSSVEGVMKLDTGVVIKVEAETWKECLTSINETCSYGWRIINSNKQRMDLGPEQVRDLNISLRFSQQYCCHRADSYKSVAASIFRSENSSPLGIEKFFHIYADIISDAYLCLEADRRENDNAGPNIKDTNSSWKLEKSEKAPCCVIIGGCINTPDKKIFLKMIKKDELVFEFLKVVDNFYYVQKKKIMDKSVDESTFAVNLIDKFHSIFIASRLNKWVESLHEKGQKVDYSILGNCFRGEKQIGRKTIEQKKADGGIKLNGKCLYVFESKKPNETSKNLGQKDMDKLAGLLKKAINRHRGNCCVGRVYQF